MTKITIIVIDDKDAKPLLNSLKKYDHIIFDNDQKISELAVDPSNNEVTIFKSELFVQKTGRIRL